MDTNASFKVKIIGDIALPRIYKTAGPEGLPPPFLRDNGEVSSSELTLLLKSIWARNKIA